MTLSSWFNSLFGRGDAAPPVSPGTPALVVGRQAEVAVESASCDALCGVDASAPAALNALGQRVAVHATRSDIAAVDVALGLSLTGQRAAAFVGGASLGELSNRLAAAAGRRAPLVVHAALAAPARQSATRATGHEGYHAVADSGALLALARDAQQAADLSLAMRRVAETSPTPCVLATDALETAHGLQQVLLPEGALVRELVGAPGAELDAPTPGQQLVFGERRKRVPATFDASHPMTLGVQRAASAHAAGLTGQRVFFEQHVEALVAEACEAVAKRTGRPLPLVSSFELKGARHVLVAQGSLVELAEGAAAYARGQGQKVGVLGVVWLRPLPAEAIRAALTGVEVVTVLERSPAVLGGEPPLSRELRAALGAGGPKLRSAIVGADGGAVRAADLVALCDDSTPAARTLFTGAPVAKASSGFPKREALLQAIKKAYPAADAGLVAGAAVDVRPKGARTVAWCVASAAPADDGLSALGAVVAAAANAPVRARWCAEGAFGWTARLTAGEGNRDAADDAPVELVLVDGVDAAVRQLPPAVLRDGAAVVVQTAAPEVDLWQQLPSAWREAVKACDGRLFVAPAGPLAASTLQSLWGGSAVSLLEVGWKKLPAAAVGAELPAAVRRIGRARAALDSLPRFYGEVVQPALQGERVAAVPEPWTAVGAAPAGAAAFGVERAVGPVPVIDAAKCTGCGQCWTACPDSALGVVALKGEALLNAGAERVGERSPIADRLKRQHKQLVARVDTALTEKGARVATADDFRQTLQAAMPKLGVTKDDEPAVQQAFDATLAQLDGAFPFSAAPLFHAAPGRELLLLAVDMRACQSCGGCAAVCGEKAITLAPPSPETLAAAAKRWGAWERLPDTAGDTIARASKTAEIGPLAGVLMARTCQGALPGGDRAEPGSGARLAVRQLAAVVESELQRRMAQEGSHLSDLATKLRDKLKTVLAQGLPAADFDALAQALAGEGKRTSLAEVLARVTPAPTSPTVDAPLARRLAELVPALESLQAQWARGVDGLGRARMAVVVAGASEPWLAGFPGSAPYAPVYVESLEGSSVVLGLANGLMARTLAEYRLVRSAELAVDAPADLEAQLAKLAALGPDDVPPEAWGTCPPLLVLTHADTLGPQSLATLFDLLGAKLPVKVVVLDALDADATRPDATLFALAHRETYVAATSVAHGAHFYGSAKAALAFRGPAVLHVHAPSPSRDGFSADATVAQARAAVETRAHPLVTYDPAAAGHFGARLSLAGNAEAAPATPLHWALGTGRGRKHAGAPTSEDVVVEKWLELAPTSRKGKAPTASATGAALAADASLAAWTAQRVERWSILRELAGVQSPFVDRVRAEAKVELEAAFRAEKAQLEADYAVKVAALERGYRERVAGELKARLLQLTAHAEKRS